MFQQSKVIPLATRYSSTELWMLPDCAGLLVSGKCKLLRVSSCMGARCSYYQETNTPEKMMQRLRSLDEDTQERIPQKNYGGCRP